MSARALVAVVAVAGGGALVYAVSILLHIAATMNSTVVKAEHLSVNLDDVVTKLTAVLLSIDAKDEA